MSKHTQHADIIEYLNAGNTLTGLEALKLFGTMKLSSRVSELKRAGYPIQSEMVRGNNKKHYCRYWLERTGVEEIKARENLFRETDINYM